MTSDYSEVEHGQSNNGQITMTVQPSTAAAPKPAQRTSQRSNQARLKVIIYLNVVNSPDSSQY